MVEDGWIYQKVKEKNMTAYIDTLLSYCKRRGISEKDIVPVVRCKNCKWYKEGKYFAPARFCYRLKDANGEEVGYNFADDDFCSYGERRGE